MADNRKYIQAQKFKLSNGISLSDTSIALESFNLPDGTAIASGDIGTVNYATIEPGTSNEEQISFTGFTSTTLTGVTRGLDFAAPYTAVSGNRKAHAAGAILVISNTAAFYDNFLNKNNDETIAGIHTYTNPNYPKMDSVTAAPTDDEEFATKGYVDDVGAGGTLSKNRTVIAGTAGATVAAGNIVYFDTTDKEWKLADASTAATSENVILGIAQGAGTDGNTIAGGVLINGLDENQSGLTAGTKYYLSDTAGAIATSAGTVEVSIGYSNSGSTTTLIFEPRYDQQITEDIQDALAGTSGTPSNSNKYVTADDVAENTASKAVRRQSNSNITVPATPTASTDAASKSYIEAQDAVVAGDFKRIFVSSGEFNLVSNVTDGQAGGGSAVYGLALYADGVTGIATANIRVPYGATAISSVKCLYSREVSADVVMRFRFTLTDTDSLPDTGTTDNTDNGAAYTVGGTDDAIESITVPSASYNAISSVDIDDILSIEVVRVGGDASDTYGATFRVLGVEVIFS